MYGDRIRELRKSRRLTQDELGKICNVTGKTIGSWEREERQPSIEQINKLAVYFNVTSDSLIGSNDLKTVSAGDFVQIPVVGSIKAGPDGYVFNDFDGYEAFLRSDIKSNKEYMVLKVKGDSMIGDGIYEGDTALIERDADYIKNKIYAVIVNGYEATLKHVIEDGNSILLVSSNPAYPPRLFTGKEMAEVKMVGKLVKLSKHYD